MIKLLNLNHLKQLFNRVEVLFPLSLMVCVVIWMGCSVIETPKSSKKDIRFEVPKNFPAPNYRFENNSITPEGFALGKALFYDGILSRDGSVSCGSCHQQSAAFTHFDHPVSHGIDDQLGTRNAPALVNLAWQNEFFWDGGVHDLDLQPPVAIENPVEMDEKLDHVLEKIRQHSQYPSMFEKAFGTKEVTTARFLKSMSQFMLMLVSSNSKYDRFIRNEGVKLTQDEADGLALFRQKCATCHPEPLFTDNSFRNNGLVQRSDEGRKRITLREEDAFTFKVPTLRNVATSMPYMHDGRFKTLEDILDHYSEGVQPSATLDPALSAGGMKLTQTEKQKIIAFLKTLTDEDFLEDTRFSEF